MYRKSDRILNYMFAFFLFIYLKKNIVISVNYTNFSKYIMLLPSPSSPV